MSLFPKILPEAEQEITAYSDYLADRDPAVAERFADAMDTTIKMLLDNPNLGERLRVDLTGELRYRTILDFKNYLIYFKRVEIGRFQKSVKSVDILCLQ